jgi:hypothetical protein
LSKNSWKKEKNMIKQYQPMMNGSNLTEITERLGIEKLKA